MRGSAELNELFDDYISRFLEGNQAARDMALRLHDIGIGLMPVVDHCTIRTMNVDKPSGTVFKIGLRL